MKRPNIVLIMTNQLRVWTVKNHIAFFQPVLCSACSDEKFAFKDKVIYIFKIMHGVKLIDDQFLIERDALIRYAAFFLTDMSRIVIDVGRLYHYYEINV